MRHRKYPFIAGFLFVPVVLYAVFVIWPYIQTFGYSLTDWSGQSQTMNFVGFDNYSKLFSDSVFKKALVHNMLILVFLPVITILLALFFAFMLNVGGRGRAGAVQGVRGAGIYKIVFFFPQVLSIAILTVLFQAVYRSDEGGLFNGVLVKLGLEDKQHPIEWLNSPDLVLWCIIGVLIWAGVGFYLVLFSAAMQSIPKEIYEAALLDGARRGQTFFRVTLPLLWDSVQTAWVYLAIAAMDVFALVATLTPGAYYGGGPDFHSEVMATYLMRNFLTYGKSGYACAMGVVILLLTLILSAITLRITRRERIEF
ncbi:carbohydrate ABC transporter permease [Wenjunlia tyrosinilytica]|uniref:Sugar ABC transporter permease n=1 Tax=Wenjunlia tyrosinilytica TaxID=1544741 RepID=A0A917ZRD9_9ACTN|nr:sugar ABC transporter permease [Wenjunlia tyrosinilytica]GGO91109.1 sugar ABC transporter permease [Wenjunlia tyrosinilytica]